MKNRKTYETTEVAEKYSVSSKRVFLKRFAKDSGACGQTRRSKSKVIIERKAVRKCPG